MMRAFRLFLIALSAYLCGAADPSLCSAHSACSKAGLEGACCPNEEGKFLDCCGAECSKHSKCAHLNITGFCCPTADKEMMDCCNNGDDLQVVQQPEPEDPSLCSAHSTCSKAGLEGACCPNEEGKFLDCCGAECSKHSKCAHLNITGFCCPTADKEMMDCCSNGDDIQEVQVLQKPVQTAPVKPSQCAAHTMCSKAGLEGACCPDREGKMLDCCDAECSKHTACSHLTGYCCPSFDDKMMDCCQGNSSIVLVV